MFVKIYYKTYNSKLLIIVNTFKILKYYIKDSKYKVFILINNNNFYYFIYI